MSTPHSSSEHGASRAREIVEITPVDEEITPVDETVELAPATDKENAAAVAAGGAALGAIIALVVSTNAVSPIVGAIVGGVLGAAGGKGLGHIVKPTRPQKS